MRSSSGEHYLALDHVRALAAFLVFSWHFTHGDSGYPVPFEYVPAVFPLALLDEGHTGVSLFMTLSGYLFAKLLDGRQVVYTAFFWNRFLRLAPLLAVVLVLNGLFVWLVGEDLAGYAVRIARGLIFPTLPNGGWSITIEVHFYLLLPLFLWLGRRWKGALPMVLLAALALRFVLHREYGEVQELAYRTLVGRLDQFLLGMLAFEYRSPIAKHPAVVAAGALAFMIVYWRFDVNGGFYLSPSYPSPTPLWIVLPTLEGAAYGAVIAWYDQRARLSDRGLSRFVGRIGAYSYSIYLLHFYIVFSMADFVHQRVMPISNFYVACLWALLCFLLMVPIGYLSFRFIESPFLRLRRRYTVAAGARPDVAPAFRP